LQGFLHFWPFFPEENKSRRSMFLRPVDDGIHARADAHPQMTD